jgi:hypothetical protein
MAGTAADLHAGFEFFLEFAVEEQAINQVESDELLGRFDEAMMNLVKDQNCTLAEQDPVTWFFDLLRSAILKGSAHVANWDGGPPLQDPQGWGWEERTSFVKKVSGDTKNDDEEEGDKEEEFEERTARWPKGDRVGWLAGENLYLLPPAAMAAAQKLAEDTDQHLPLTERTLGARLRDKGLLLSRDAKRNRNTVRVNVQGVRPNVLHVQPKSVIRPAFTGQEWAEDDYPGPVPTLDDIIKAQDLEA